MKKYSLEEVYSKFSEFEDYLKELESRLYHFDMKYLDMKYCDLIQHNKQDCAFYYNVNVIKDKHKIYIKDSLGNHLVEYTII